MSEYYAVIRSTDHLEHYGIKGMKWGVRKAIERGDQKRLDRYYRKARRKLEKLNSKADIDIQHIAAQRHAAKAIGAFGLSAGLGGIPIALNRKKARSELHAVKDAIGGFYQNYPGSSTYFTGRRKKIVGEGKGIYTHGEGLGTGPVGNAASVSGAHVAMNGGGKAPIAASGSNKYITRDRIAKAVMSAGFGAAAYQAGKAIAAKRRTTKKGHAKAVKKRDAWKNQMNEVFKGTKYDMNKRRKSK